MQTCKMIVTDHLTAHNIEWRSTVLNAIQHKAIFLTTENISSLTKCDILHILHGNSAIFP